MYYVISLVHTYKHDKYITLWRPNNAGYCYSKDMAGLYETVQKDYHDSDSNMPITEEKANELFTMQVKDSEDNWHEVIPNEKQTWRKLNVKMTKNGLKKL